MNDVIFGINVISTDLGFCDCPHSLRSPLVEVVSCHYLLGVPLQEGLFFRVLLSLKRSEMMGTDISPLPTDGWRIFISLLGGVSCVSWLDSRLCCV